MPYVQKRIFISPPCLLCLIFQSQAQVSLIPKVGFSITDYSPGYFKPSVGIYPSNSEKVSDQEGMVGGLGIDIPLKKDSWSSLMPELNYVQRNISIEGTTRDNYFRHARRLNYIEIPVLIKGTIQKGKVSAYVNMGPSIGYGLVGYYVNTVEHYAGAFEYESDTITYEGGIQNFKGKLI